MISVIIPAHNEERFLNRTIQNIYDTAEDEIEVLVLLQGYKQEVDSRAIIMNWDFNCGERAAMNHMANVSNGEYLLRIDAHCDFQPKGWDKKMVEVLERHPKALCVGVLTAIYHHTCDKKNPDPTKDWTRLPGHWYGLCKLMPNMEAKWYKPNHFMELPPIVRNMGATGCGMLIRKDFYEEIGGADESLPAMGAIGEEFAIKAWLEGDGCFTRTDVTIGHIFSTGGYDTNGVVKALEMLREKYGDCYEQIAAHFPDWKDELMLISAKQPGPDIRTVIIDRTDTHDTKNAKGEVIHRLEEYFRYVWLENQHPSEKNLTDKQIEEKYAPQGTKIGEQAFLANMNGKLDKV
jgi:glycosyltransferase involved in cell wall biosynthesis